MTDTLGIEMTAGTTDNTDKSGKTGRWAPWRNLRWAFIAIWLVFLAYPMQSLAAADVSAAAKVLGFVLLVAFAVVYTITAVHALAGPPGHVREGLIALVSLTAITVALTPTIHENALGTGPFLMAVAAFTLPLAWAVGVIAVLLAATLLIPGWAGWGSDTNIAIIMTVVAFTMLGIRFLRAREVEREEAEEARRSLNERLAVVAERERLARDVHDILGHSLTVITVKSELAGKLLDRDPDRAREEMTDINTLARQALSEVRATVGQLRTPDMPTTLASAATALRAADIEAAIPDPDDVPDDVPDVFAWVLREAVTNVVRHSGATRCEITLTPTSITVHDNGSGLNDAIFGNGLGGLRERVASAGGHLTVESVTDGTTLKAEMNR